MEQHQHLQSWLKIGRNNPWIKGAWDPPFTDTSFHECADMDELMEKFEHGNWSLGQAFVLGDVCFIQQVDGGDEWLTITEDVPFESVSFKRIIETRGRDHAVALLEWLVLEFVDYPEH